jgi:hypothetical protein
MSLASSPLTFGYGTPNRLITLGYSIGISKQGCLFDNLVAWAEKQPSERFARAGWGQPGFTTECRLLIGNVNQVEASPGDFFKPGFFQPGLFSKCKLLTANIEAFEKT